MHSKPTIWILGATMINSNKGVMALAESSLKCIFHRWPNARVLVHCYAYEKEFVFNWGAGDKKIDTKTIWSGKNLLLKNNLWQLYLLLLLYRLIPFASFRDRIYSFNPLVKELVESDYVADITGGDSFTDIYGVSDFIEISLIKYLFIFAGKQLLFMPQTYGPFNKKLSTYIAGKLLCRSQAVFSRDEAGLTVIDRLTSKCARRPKVDFVPDMAFVLDPEKVDSSVTSTLNAWHETGETVVGLNVSGLLWESPSKEKFSLKVDYQLFIERLVETLMASTHIRVILVPHVISRSHAGDNDVWVSKRLLERVGAKVGNRVIFVEDELNHRQMKYIIGLCDFFIGSRMHACIGALSQQIPALGCAYSDKFEGVFRSVGVGDLVLDLRSYEVDTAIDRVGQAIKNRVKYSDILAQTIPDIKARVISHLDCINDIAQSK